MATTECPLSSPSQSVSEPSEVTDCSVANDEFLIQVRAQVMTRDDSSGGWLPTNGGGMSVVDIHAAPPPANSHYTIRGRRVCDQAVVLDCAVTDDLLYVKATPTFHHWRTRGKRFGLTFHSSADAQVFETCIQRATQQLQERPLCNKEDGCEDDDDEEAIMKLQPPADAKEVSSLPASRTRTPSPCATMRVHCTAATHRTPSSFYHPFSCPHLDFVGNRTLLSRPVSERQEQLLRKSNLMTENQLCGQPGSQGTGDEAPVRSDGYVRFSRTDVSAEGAPSVASRPSHATPKSSYRLANTSPTPPTSSHEYEYPVLLPSGSARSRDSSSLPPTIQQVSLPRRKLRKSGGRKSQKRVAAAASTRARCLYCQELFFVAENRSGACPDAPDDCAACIEHATCLCAARALLYHCATDDDGNYGSVCVDGESSSPGSGSSSERRRRRKWALLALLSVVLPCLWCYPALTACHRCAVRHGHCGARHRAA